MRGRRKVLVPKMTMYFKRIDSEKMLIKIVIGCLWIFLWLLSFVSSLLHIRQINELREENIPLRAFYLLHHRNAQEEA